MQKEYGFYAYILTNYAKTVFYAGFTNDIVRRTIEHKNGLGSEFTRKYRLKYLVYYEQTENVYDGIAREKEIKKWRKEKKLTLIKTINPGLVDLSPKLFKEMGIGKKEIEAIVKELRNNYRWQK